MGKSSGFAHRLYLALGNGRLQLAIGLISVPPILVTYLWRTSVDPVLNPGTYPIDFYEDYVVSGRLVASGGDPYTECISRTCWLGLTSAGSVYPPVVAWLSQPLSWVDHANHTILMAGASVAAQVCVAVFLIATTRALGIRTWRALILVSVLVISFPPLDDEVVQRNIEVLLLALSGIWFVGWVAGDRWWAGVALGVGLALKLVQAPMLLLGIWFRRTFANVAAILVLGALWLVGEPRLLPEYLFKVLPAINTGTGYAMDVAPVAAIQRLFHPGSLYGQDPGVDPTARLIGYLIAAAVVILTALALRAPRPDPMGRALEAAAVVAATPLIVAVVRPGHLVLLLLPMLVLGTLAVRQRNVSLGLAVVISWLLAGPVYLWFTKLMEAGLRGPFVRPGEETAMVGIAVLWIAALVSLRRHSPEPRAQPPAIAPTIRKGSVPATTASGRGASGDSSERSSSQAKNLSIGRRSWVRASRIVPRKAG